MSQPKDTGRVAIVDDEARMGEVLAMVLRRDGHQVQTWTDPLAFVAAIEADPDAVPDVVLSDLRMPGLDGLGLLARVHAVEPQLPVVLVTAHGTVQSAIEALRAGAWDFIEKPVDNSLCRAVVARAMAVSALRRENRRLRASVAAGLPEVIAESAQMNSVLARVRRAARASSPVLVTGESGTGKEIVARLVHHHSPRVGGPFVAVNCRAFGAGVLESELFGHERGAFTGAERARPGVFERAHGGTLFLDELGEVDLSFQAKLLRVLQEGEVQRVGADRPRAVDVRVVCATHRDLPAEIAAGRFREDLYFRIAVIPLHLPPLRERPDDILPLARHLLARACTEQDRPDLEGFAADVPAWLLAQPWRGNVRELANTIERGVVLAAGPQVEVDDLRMPGGPPRPADQPGLHAWLEQQAAARIRAVLAEVGGVRVDAADKLGIERTTLYRLMKKHGIS